MVRGGVHAGGQTSLYLKRAQLNELPPRLRCACQLDKARLIRKVDTSQMHLKKKYSGFLAKRHLFAHTTLSLNEMRAYVTLVGQLYRPVIFFCVQKLSWDDQRYLTFFGVDRV